MPKKITILGATGSVGRQTLDIISAFPDKFEVFGLSANRNLGLLQEQILKFRPQVVVVPTLECQLQILQFLAHHQLSCEIFVGPDGLSQLAKLKSADLLIAAIVGTSAILPVFQAITSGIPVGLANKEVLVSAGDQIMARAKALNVPILPVDSEHAAIKQCLAGIFEDPAQIQKLILTASGGPFLNYAKSDFATITPEAALRHPKWSMGPKITIDSATMMNKGLEVIEAHHLFGVPYSQIEVVIHPQSIVHSAVEFVDGTVLAQMGLPDMRFPIQYVLSYPEKHENPWPKMSLPTLQTLTFEQPKHDLFPLLSFAYTCGQEGGTWPVVMNAANEAAVTLFLDHKIFFIDIAKIVKSTTESFKHVHNPSLSDIINVDKEIKERLATNYA